MGKREIPLTIKSRGISGFRFNFEEYAKAGGQDSANHRQRRPKKIDDENLIQKADRMLPQRDFRFLLRWITLTSA